MGSVFYRNPVHDYPVAVRGQGIYLYDDQGREYLDGSGGAAISCLGHAHPAVIEAIERQAGEMAFAHTAFFTNQPQEQLAKRLAARFPETGARVYFVSGGSEANETAIKLARQYWRSAGKPDKHIIISRQQSYHGNTLGALSITGHLKRRAAYEPMLHDWPRIEPCHAYRCQRDGESETQYAQRSADQLEQAINAAGPDQVSAFFAETVVGASLGAVPAASGYFQRIREICDRYEVLLVLDEVMAGGGRTGSYFAFEQESVVPDIVTLAKGLGGGYQPIGAVLSRQEIHQAIALAGDSFSHGHTYVGHATACAAGLAVQDVLDQDDLLNTVVRRGEQMGHCLQAAFSDHPNVGDIRGRGLFWGMEFVLDRQTGKPVEAQQNIPARLRKAAMAKGLICYPGGGTADGKDGAHVLLAPPFIITEVELSDLCERLLDAVNTVDFNAPA